MSLLVALVAESFITDQELMLNIHQDAFNMASENLLANKHFEDIKQDFYKMVTATILTLNWQMPMAIISHLSARPSLQLIAGRKLRETTTGLRSGIRS